jgi:uncharacterized repeat protein (TIGR02543 family)
MKAKKILSVFLALTIAVGLIPATALTASAWDCDDWWHDWDWNYDDDDYLVSVTCNFCGIYHCEVNGHGSWNWYHDDDDYLVSVTCGSCGIDRCEAAVHLWWDWIYDDNYVIIGVACELCGEIRNCEIYGHGSWQTVYDNDDVLIGVRCGFCRGIFEHDCEIHDHYFVDYDGGLICVTCSEIYDCKDYGHWFEERYNNGVRFHFCHGCGVERDCAIHNHQWWRYHYNDNWDIINITCWYCDISRCEARLHWWNWDGFPDYIVCRLCDYVHDCITCDRWWGDWCEVCDKEKPEIISFSVTFDLGGGTRTGGGELTQTVAQGGTATAPTATRTGFTFTGWDRAFNNITGNITITALWTAIPVNHTVTFNPNNGTLATAQRTRTVNQGSAVGSLPTPTRTGHTFAGWFTAATGGTQVTAATIINGNATYFARWTAQTFTITYNRNGGTNPANAPARYTFGTSTTLPTPTRAGHTFAGWFNNASFTGSRITSTGTARTGNLTLFARWTVNRYTVTFDVNGGSALSAANRTRTRDHNATVGTLPTPTRANHTFAGWFTTRTGGTRITTTQRITTNTTYFARWIANPARPANPRATANSRTEITVSWNRVTGATGYEVWRSTSANGTFTRVRDVTSGSTLSWRNTGLVADRQYFYRVRAYTTVNGVKAFGPYTATFNARTRR